MAEAEVAFNVLPDVPDTAVFGALFDKAETGADQAAPKGRAANGQFVPAVVQNATVGAEVEAGATDEAKKDEAASGDALEALLDLDPDALSAEETAGSQEAEAELDETQEIEVRVEGKPVKVTLKELRDNYSGEKAIEKRIQAATEARNLADQEARKYAQAAQVNLNKLQHLDSIIETFAQPKINWEHLKATDPLGYALKREEMRDWQDKQTLVRKEIQQVREQQAEIQADATQKYLIDQAEALISKLPDMADPNKSQALMGRVMSAAKAYGITEQEVGSIMKHEYLLVLNDAAKYRELVERKAAMTKGVTPSAPTKTMRTVGSKPAAVSEKQKLIALTNKARQTGKDDDIAALLLVPKKKA